MSNQPCRDTLGNGMSRQLDTRRQSYLHGCQQLDKSWLSLRSRHHRKFAKDVELIGVVFARRHAGGCLVDAPPPVRPLNVRVDGLAASIDHPHGLVV